MVHKAGRQSATQEPEEFVFRVQYVVSTNLSMQEPSTEITLPMNKPRRWKNEVMSKEPMRLEAEDLARIEGDIARRARLDFEERFEAPEEGDDIEEGGPVQVNNDEDVEYGEHAVDEESEGEEGETDVEQEEF